MEDLPPLEYMTDEALRRLDIEATKRDKSKRKQVQLSTLEEKVEDPVIVWIVFWALLFYIATCAYVYLCPGPSIPWEIEFAVPAMNVSSNCTIRFLRPFEGEVISDNSLHFELSALSNDSKVPQIAQYSVHVDEKLVVIDLAILARDGPAAFKTPTIEWLNHGDHIAVLTVVVPLRGGEEEIIRSERRFHWVPQSHPIVRLNLKPSGNNVCYNNSHRILKPTNESFHQADTDIEMEILVDISQALKSFNIIVDGESQLVTPRGKTRFNGLLANLSEGVHQLQLADANGKLIGDVVVFRIQKNEI